MTVHLLLPAGFDDTARPSGGNNYDRRLVSRLPSIGVHTVSGPWPRRTRLAEVERAVAAVPDGEVLLVDGLIASGAAAALVPQARRVRLVVLLHMPLFDGAEEAVLSAAAGVITTSAWSRDQVLDRYRLDPDRVRIARPGADPAPLAAGTDGGGSLLCVGTVAPHKGQDLLLAALERLDAFGWRCVCAGSLSADHDFVAGLRRDRVDFPGVLTGSALEQAYADADVLIVPSRAETYGMVVTEALARGLPVIATDVGGLPEALGFAPSGARPGRLIAPNDPDALAAAIRHWLLDGAERERLRAAARGRRATLRGWDATVGAVAEALEEFAGVRAEL